MILVIGLVSNVILIAGGFFTLRKSSSKTTFIFAGIGFLAALVTMGLSWLAYMRDKAVVQEAIVNAGATIESEIAMTGITSAGGNVTLGLWLSVLPLLLGLVLLVRGLFLLPAEERQAGKRAPLIAVTICLSMGLGLSLAAFIDYLRFHDFFLLLLWLS